MVSVDDAVALIPELLDLLERLESQSSVNNDTGIQMDVNYDELVQNIKDAREEANQVILS